ncbi:MAG: hypothetical protein IPP59_18325 [Betaproteobacteria bacterium]|nr:hypothetical protein [Candidatus Dechloromonas phosphorivorans]
MIERLLSDRIVERLRAAQGVLRLQQTYAASRLEAACASGAGARVTALPHGEDHSGVAVATAERRPGRYHPGGDTHSGRFCPAMPPACLPP